MGKLIRFKRACLSTLLMAGAVIPAHAVDLIEVYKHLHANPELSLMEVETSRYLAEKLETMGYTVTRDVGGTGVVAVLENGPGKTVLIRADMDGLPVLEQTGLPFASTVMRQNAAGETQPAMHACGHDVHMTSLLGTADAMMKAKDTWQGTLVLALQPAEEIVKGAEAMISDGLFERFPRPDYNLALHVNSAMASGKVGLVSGYALANVDSVDIIVPGIGGHGAYPHTTKDPVVTAAQIIMGLQTIVSREVSPQEAAVVTVGRISGGTKRNIIGKEVKLELTVRSYKDEVRAHTLEAIERISTNIGRAAGLPDDMLPKVVLQDESAPATYNDPVLTDDVAEFMTAALGPDNVIFTYPVMGAEDFAHFGRTNPRIPSMMFWLGGANPEDVAAAAESGDSLPSLHSPFFAPDAQATLETGVKAMTASAMGLLKGTETGNP